MKLMAHWLGLPWECNYYLLLRDIKWYLLINVGKVYRELSARLFFTFVHLTGFIHLQKSWCITISRTLVMLTCNNYTNRVTFSIHCAFTAHCILSTSAIWLPPVCLTMLQVNTIILVLTVGSIVCVKRKADTAVDQNNLGLIVWDISFSYHKT